MTEKASDTRYLLLAFVISTGLLFFHLGSNRLQSWDEALYAESSKEMVASGDYLTPHWNQERFLQKPPLAIWATALLFKIFGVNETAARTFSALAGVGCVVITFLLGRLFMNGLASFAASLILLVSPHFNYYARQGGLEAPLTFFMLLALYAYLKSVSDSRWWLLVGAASGLAVMTKGAAAAPLLVSLFLAVALARSRVWTTKYFWIGLGLFLIIGGAWHAAMLQLYGRQFLQEYVGEQILARSTQVIDTKRESPLLYVTTIFFGFLPMVLLLPSAALRVWRKREFPVVLTIFAVAVFAMYTIVSTKHPWYVTPLYPVLALVLLGGLKCYRVFAICAAVALFHSVFLDRHGPYVHPEEPAIIARAQSGSGPFEVEIDFAPAVLFYSNRKICVDAPDHSMGQLTRCDSSDYSHKVIQDPSP